MSTARANLETVISADMTQFQATMKRAGIVATSTASKIAKSMGSAAASLTKAGLAAGALGAVIGGAAMVKGIKAAADLGGKLSDLSARTSIAAGDLAVLSRAFEDNGVSADKIGGIINKLQKAVVDFGDGSASAARPFDRLGISFQQISRLDPAAQFSLVQQKISAISDPAERAAVAMQLFGKSGGELLTLFADGGALTTAGNVLGSQADILNRSAGKFDEISDILARAGTKLQGFFVGLLDGLADDLLPALREFDALDLAAAGQAFAEAMKEVTGSSGDFVENMKSALDGAFQFSQIVSKTGKYIGAMLGSLASPDFWSGLGDMILATLIQPLARYQDALTAIINGESVIDAVMGKNRDSALSKWADGVMNNGIEKVKPFMDEFAEILAPPKSLKEIFKDVPKAAKEAVKVAKEEIQVSGPSGSPIPMEFAPNQAKGHYYNPSEMGPQSPSFFEMGPSKSLMRKDVADMIAKREAAATAGFSGLAGLYQMQQDRMGGGGDTIGINSALSGGSRLFGSRTGSVSGVASGLVTGGLGESRRLKTSADTKAAKQVMTIQEAQADSLASIDKKIAQSLTVN